MYKIFKGFHLVETYQELKKRQFDISIKIIRLNIRNIVIKVLNL